MRYARSDVQSYQPPGGVCAGHSETADPDELRHFAVDCLTCDPHLAHDPLWAGTPEECPLTEAEQKVADKLERDAQAAQAQFAHQMAMAGMAEAAKQLAAVNAGAAGQAAAAPAARPATKRARASKRQQPAQA